jgi:hypothetical protein
LESHYESANVEAFADDNNLLACLDIESITAVKSNLSQFAQISGLKCNVDKSQILLIGSDADPPEFLTNSGFEISNKLKILGFEVTKNFIELENNFDKTIDKLKNIARFWDRFKLSLSGRINVSKTLMISQISFLGSIITPSKLKIDEMQKVINNYVLGKIRFNNKLLCIPPDQGGLGLINIEDFITSLQCSWIKKAAASRADNW